MSEELGARLPRGPASHHLLLVGSDAQPPGAPLPLGLPTPTSLKQQLLTCLWAQAWAGSRAGRGSPQHFVVGRGSRRPCPILAASGHIQWDKPLIHSDAGTRYTLCVLAPRWPSPFGCPSTEDWGTDLAEGGDAYLNLPFQAWGTTSPSSHWEEREPDPQAGGQVHDQDARPESAS